MSAELYGGPSPLLKMHYKIFKHLHSPCVADAASFRGGWMSNRPSLTAWIAISQIAFSQNRARRSHSGRESLLHVNVYFFFRWITKGLANHHSSHLICSQLLHECNFNLLLPLPFISYLSWLSRICCVPLHYEFPCFLLKWLGDAARPPSIF